MCQLPDVQAGRDIQPSTAERENGWSFGAIKLFAVWMLCPLNSMVCFMKISERRRIREKIIDSGETYYSDIYMSTHVKCANENTFAPVASQGLEYSWAREWVFLWSNKPFCCLDFWPLEHHGVFHEDQRQKEDSWKFYQQWGKTYCFVVAYHFDMCLPMSMCLPHVYESVPHLCVYPTSVSLHYVYVST